MPSKIRNPARAKQLIDFDGLFVDGYIFPTDIDGLLEYRDCEYIIFEIKYKGAEVPFGQKLALQRMVDDFAKIGKRAIVLVGEHTVSNPDNNIKAADCTVREVYCGTEHCWRPPVKNLTLREAVDSFHLSAAMPC